MTATLQRLRIQERMTADVNVDRENGVLRNVKIIGTVSSNGRTYPIDTLRRAANLYEGAVVNTNHAKGSAPRLIEDRFGRLRQVRVQRDGDSPGLYADLHFLKEHPMAARVCEAARTMPDLVGLSHNVDGQGKRTDKGFVVEEIARVISVDLVTDPASTKSLFEGAEREPREPRVRSADGPTDAEIRSGRQRANGEADRDGATQAGDVIRGLYSRLTVGVVNDFDLTTAEKAKAIEELLSDEQYALDQLQKFGRFYHRVSAGRGDVFPLPGDPVQEQFGSQQALKDSFRAAVLALFDDESLSLQQLSGGIEELLKAFNAATQQQADVEAPLPLPEGFDIARSLREEDYSASPRGGALPTGKKFMEHLRNEDATEAAPRQARRERTVPAMDMPTGARFMEHLRSPACELGPEPTARPRQTRLPAAPLPTGKKFLEHLKIEAFD